MALASQGKRSVKIDNYRADFFQKIPGFEFQTEPIARAHRADRMRTRWADADGIKIDNGKINVLRTLLIFFGQMGLPRLFVMRINAT